MNNAQNDPVRKDIMDAIRAGEVRMRPRWHFVLLSALAIVGALILSLTLLYLTSLAVFFLHESGAWFAPDFGGRGWIDLLLSVSWKLVLLVAVFVLLLEVLVRRYAFVYKKPLLISVLGILLFVTLGGIVIGQTPLHRELAASLRRGELPPPMRVLYGDDGALRPPPPGELYRGVIVSMDADSFVIANANRPGTTTIYISPRTRLPRGGDFAIGNAVVIIGDMIGTGTIRAFGVREIEE